MKAHLILRSRLRSPIRRRLAFLIFLIWVILPTPHLTLAQSQSDLPIYWQYAASGRLTHLAMGDVDRDGIDEFIIADENNRVDLVDAAGKQIWSFVAPDRVTSIAAYSAADSENRPMGVVVGLPNQLLLLSSSGAEVWRTPINPIDTPTTLRGEGRKAADSQLEGYEFLPIDIKPYDHDRDGEAEILTLLQSGELLLFDALGNLVWQHTDHPSEGSSAMPRMLLSDLDQDGQDEIVLAIYDPRRFGQLVLIDNGLALWDISLSRQITDLVEVTFEPGGQPLIAVGTSLGHVYTYDYDRERQWLRTLNTPVTSLAQVATAGGNELAVGTDSGTVLTFNREGRRSWVNQLTSSPDQPVLDLAAALPGLAGNQPVLAATVQSDRTETNTADAYLLDRQGQTLSRIGGVDTKGLTAFTDSNHDSNGELLVARFAALEMLGMGVGNSGNVQEWEYSLNAAPAAELVVDLDGDGRQELVIGTKDGRVHSLNNDRSIRWLHDAGGSISHLATQPNAADGSNNVVIAGLDQHENPQGAAWIQVREPKGERIWEQRLDSPVTSLLVADVLPADGYEVIAGNQTGELFVFSSEGELLYRLQSSFSGNGIEGLLFLPGRSSAEGELVAFSGSSVIGINLSDPTSPVRSIATLDGKVFDVYAGPAAANQEMGVWLLVLTSNGRLHGYNWRGIEMAQWQWPQTLGGNPTAAISLSVTDVEDPVQDSIALLLGTDSGQLTRLNVTDNQPNLPWQFEQVGNITAVHGYDQNHDGQPDLVLTGSHEGKVSILTGADTAAPQPAAAPIELSSAVFGLDTIDRDVGQAPDIVVVTENGLVQLFRDQENRPPLLTNPTVALEGNQYSISVTINDVERDEVLVSLEVLEEESGAWLDQGTQKLSDGRGTLFWALASPAAGPQGFIYRFAFSDGSYRGSMTPPPGPSPILVSPWPATSPLVLAGAIALGLIAMITFARQSQTPSVRAGRFYRSLKKNPGQNLKLFEQQARAGNLQVMMPYLASLAREENDRIVANLADGLFLLADQPQSGLPIVHAALEEMSLNPDLNNADLDRWITIVVTSLALLEAPSISELSLLQPRLAQALEIGETGEHWSPELDSLRPVLSSLHDSERVALAEDRLVYLNEAVGLIAKAQTDLPESDSSLEKLLAGIILRRWAGLVGAEIEDLRGRAEMSVVLKTRQLVPSEESVLAFEISNNGRSPAENIVADLDADPAYTVLSSPQIIQSLPPGRSREVRFTIAPHVTDRFRTGLTLGYSDRNLQGRTIAFGDMVHLLQPVRDFSPIANPYTPGTALRPDSTIFFGRDDLFDFISENAGRRSYRNVLILVGQRRTGKTSALLRLDGNLPEHLLPVYIDCQSLGVVPGMPALLEELAWYIADTLARHDIMIEVPDLDAWQRDPTRLFQRRFLPEVSALLPSGMTLLLVFDEFEAFENLVADGILPPTFFTYLRHLMQHGEQLNFIFVGTRRLEEMTSDYWSVLFNIALYRKIAFLDAASAIRLITEPVAPNLVYDDLALDKILRVTAGHPYFLQLVCYTLVKQANSRRRSYVTVSDVNTAVEEMLMLGEVHFAYLWQRSSRAERALLTTVAHLMDQNLPFSSEALSQSLAPYDIHFAPAEVTSALNSLVERDILREVTEEAKTLYELKLGLVGLWVARNKSLTKLLAGSSDEPASSGRTGKTQKSPVTSS
jgi:hypothetical protein